ncbi:phosphate-starvation-inducible PsiE family protein [Floridanema flaviceps]
MYKLLKNEQTTGGWLNKGGIVRVLETIQDLLIISLCIGLFTLMAIQLRAMFFELLPPLNFTVVTSDILFLLILVELFRLLIIYLQEQRVSIGVAVEVSIVSVLREVLVRGVLEAHWTQILSACAFLIVMALLLIVRAWLPPTFSGIDPEKMFSLRHKVMETDESKAKKQQEDYRIPANILDSNGNITGEHH